MQTPTTPSTATGGAGGGTAASTATAASSDPFLSDDFFPLGTASAAVLDALRTDEASPDADLNRRLACGGGNDMHAYRMAVGPSEQRRMRRQQQQQGSAPSANGGASAPTTPGAGFGLNGVGGVPGGNPQSPAPPGSAAAATGGASSSSSPSPFSPQQPTQRPEPIRAPPTASVVHSRTVPLPPLLSRELSTTRLSSLMGLLPEAGLAWLSVDERLYVWSYDAALRGGDGGDGGGAGTEDFCSFAVPSGQCVVSVGLVRPKKGVFKEVVEWCIVVTTPEEVILCALAFEPTATGSDGFATAGRHGTSLLLVPTRFVVPTDSIPILSVCGTRDGRIFLGGHDGCLYEMVYEGLINGGSNLRRGVVAAAVGLDGDEYHYGAPLRYNPEQSLVGAVVSGSKRAISTIVFGPSSTSQPGRPKKCRKVNHSAVAPGFVSSVVPGFVLRMASSIFGTGIPGGPIVYMVMDEERSTLYALTAKGFIHAFDLSNVGSANNLSPPPPRHACTVDASSSARRYLDFVARGKTYPPGTSSSSVISNVSYPGGSSGAQGGVGGMDGARAILKVADAEVRQKRADQSRSKAKGKAEFLESSSMLHPISISVVPRSNSKSLTLVAITGGGLRYYLTALPLSTSSMTGTMLKPGRRFTLCHVRAPPPYSALQDGAITIDSRSSGASMMNGHAATSEVGISPGMHPSQRAGSRIVTEESFFGHEVTLLAVDSSCSNVNDFPGNAIVAMTSDFSKRDVTRRVPGVASNQQANLSKSTPTRTGITEVVSLPMVESSTSGDNPATLPGGRVWDIATASPFRSSGADPSACLSRLFFQSATPTNTELSIGLVPAYFPPSRHRQSTGTRSMNGVHSSLAVASTSTGAEASRGFVSAAFAVIYRLLLNQPPPRTLQGAPVSVFADAAGKMPTYSVADRTGCIGAGFSVHPDSKRLLGSSRSYSPAASSYGRSGRDRRVGNRLISKAPRLSLWLLSPQVAPLSQTVSQHLLVNADPYKILAINSGGTHCFDNTSILDSLSSVLMKSTSSNLGKDENIRCFFEGYGFSEGCAMCLSLAVFSSSENLRRRAIQAALSFAHVPSMKPVSSNPAPAPGGLVAGIGYGSTPGHVFQSSNLYDGLASLVSRLLRPIWYKPAVVVTEGRTVQIRRQFGENKATFPAKVELLLDDGTLEVVRAPLATLQALMKDVFAPAVDDIPGAKRNQNGSAIGSSTSMDVDNGTGSSYDNGYQHLITRAMQYQSRALPRNQTAGQQNNDKDLEAKARLTEERNLHSLYRLVSRTSQLLTLMSHIRRAHETPELPEVEWGLVHGLTYCQLATTRSGQDRIETLLTNLVSAGEEMHDNFDGSASSSSTVEADNLSALLSKQCYLYFSAGSRLTYQGFRAASAALSYPPSTPRRVALANRAGLYFRAAARHWYNPALVTGRLLHIDVETNKPTEKASDKWYDKAAKRALEHGSPLARAAHVLLELGCVGATVDVCLVCASNFGGARVLYDDELAGEKELIGDNGGYAEGVMSWERGLYHRPLSGSSSPSVQSTARGSTTPNSRSAGDNPVVSGIEVTNTDALSTCHAVLFHYLTELLNSTTRYVEAPALAEQMVAVCSSSSDVRFLRRLYELLLDTGHIEFLLRISSPSLEHWIADEKKDAFLLWRYYTLHDLDWLAGQVMWRRASSVEEKIPLKERVECMTRATNSFQTAQSKATKSTAAAAAAGVFLGGLQNGLAQVRQPSLEELNRVKTQVDEQLDIATLQSKLLDAIMASNLVADVDSTKMDALEASLVPVSDMYNEYAGPLALYDICLLILRTCHENDTNSIIKLWKSILCDYIIPCRASTVSAQTFLTDLKRGSMLEEEDVVLDANAGGAHTNLLLYEDGDWIPKLKNRVISLGKDLYGQGADYTFPLQLIVKTLEGLRRVQSSSTLEVSTQISWPMQILIEVGIPYPVILDAYDSLIHQESASGRNDTNAWLQSMANVSEVLKCWVLAAGHLSNGIGDRGKEDVSAQLYRAVSSGGLLAQIDSYKASLEGCVGGNADDIAGIMASLLETENVIRRFFF